MNAPSIHDQHGADGALAARVVFVALLARLDVLLMGTALSMRGIPIRPGVLVALLAGLPMLFVRAALRV